MASIKCFWIEMQGDQKIALRRYHSMNANEAKCPVDGNHGYHDAEVIVDRVPVVIEQRKDGGRNMAHHGMDGRYAGDTRWPTACACGYAFTEKDARQVRQMAVYVRRDTGEEFDDLHHLPVGAMWEMWWVGEVSHLRGPDGRSIAVQTPGGEWWIDSRASNCTMKDDNVHKCWVRHGAPPDLHVDKNGHTCAAGAGSIQAGSYHGFLHNGHLTDC